MAGTRRGTACHGLRPVSELARRYAHRGCDPRARGPVSLDRIVSCTRDCARGRDHLDRRFAPHRACLAQPRRDHSDARSAALYLGCLRRRRHHRLAAVFLERAEICAQFLFPGQDGIARARGLQHDGLSSDRHTRDRALGRGGRDAGRRQDRGWDLASGLDRGGGVRPLDRLHIALVRPPGYFFDERSASRLREGRPMQSRLLAIFVVFVSTAAADAQNAPKKQPTIINPPPTAQDYADLAKLPDWSGVWNPKITDQDQQARNNPPPWNEKVAKEVEKMWAEEKAGRPKLIFYGCFPEAHPSWMLVTHNAMEILFTPGRVTMLGESDGNRLRRIYTDGRPHLETPDPSFHGHSIGRWEGDTLVVDTVDILPQAPLAISEAV